MPRRRKQNADFYGKMDKISATIRGTEAANDNSDSNILLPLHVRVKKILRLADTVRNNRGRMLFFVMYDIESNKVRNQVNRYLIRSGCFRIQKSIFLAETDTTVYRKIRDDLAKVQEMYDNADSIIILPISTDHVNMMKIIGKEIDVDVITHQRNTLFF